MATAFAYEGWIIATSINAELKNAKRNLPLALTFGGIIIVAIYVVYYIGIAGTADIRTLIQEGAPKGFTNLLGKTGGTAVSVLIVRSMFVRATFVVVSRRLMHSAMEKPSSIFASLCW